MYGIFLIHFRVAMVKMKMMMTMREEEMRRDQDHLFRY